MRRLMYLILMLMMVDAKAQLPIVRIVGSEPLSAKFSHATIQIDGGEILDAEVRYRGATAQRYTKKSFAIKLMQDGEKKDTTLLGMRKDNSWILDAMAIDMARMRNRVSTDLWNDFSRPSYIAEAEPGMINGTRGQFVEVYLNDEYWGLYCLTEKIDRKQLKLKKTKNGEVRGLLMKSTSFDCTFMYTRKAADYKYDNSSSTWKGWEMSYPDISDGEPIDWAPLTDDVHWLSYTSIPTARVTLHEKFDLPVWQDYFLLINLLLAEDNLGKNQYVYYYDATNPERMLGTAPWDLDHSWGRNYKGTETSSTTDFNLDRHRMFSLLEQTDPQLDTSLRERYAELRGSYFHPSSLKARFDAYFDLFEKTGAGQRETERWSGTDGFVLDFRNERIYIHHWIDQRIAYLDRIYGFAEPEMSRHINAQRPTVATKQFMNGKMYIRRDNKTYNTIGMQLQEQ